MAVVERFEAWCQCPKCGAYACHKLRKPRKPFAPIYSPKIRHESEFEVIRMCDCGHWWGQGYAEELGY